MFSIRNVSAGCLIAGAACADAPETAGFVSRLGVDTMAVSSVTWAGTSVSGVYVNRVPTTTVTRWNADLDAQANVTRVERTTTLGDSVTEKVIITLVGDSATIERNWGDSATVTRIAAPAQALPRSQATDAGLLEPRTKRMVASGLTEMIAAAFGATDSAAEADTLRLIPPDTVTFNGPRIRIDSAGRILTLGTNSERTALDIEALAEAFGSRPLGELSPRDTTTGNVGTAMVTVAYGRPKQRGRDIWGALVPWDRVWRTGAGDATFLITDQDLVIGTARVPAGKYALFTVPAQTGWTLIISRNIGENAAAYDSTADFARTAMQSGAAPERADQFTIVVEGGQLKMTWDDVMAAVPVRR